LNIVGDFVRRRNPRLYYGWIILPVAAISMFFTGPGQTYSFSIFIDSLIEEFGWTRSLVSTLYSTATLLSGLLMFLMGRLIDRFGPKWMSIASAALLGIACILGSLVINPIMLFAGFFLARFSGQGTLSLAAGTIAPQWFSKKRALAIMLAGLGHTIAAMTLPLLNTRLIRLFGWRGAFRYLGFGIWIIYIPIALLFLFNRPEELSLYPDGEKKDSGKEAGDKPAEAPSFTQTQAMSTAPFWLLAFAIFQFAMIGTAIGFHYISIMSEQGFSEVFAAKVMSVSPLAGIVSMVTIGLTLDKIKKPQLVLAAACLVQAMAYFILAFPMTSSLAYIRSAIGGSSGAVLMLSGGVLKPYLFGRRHLGGVAGAMAVITVIGSALGPVIYGLVFDVIGGYRYLLLLSSILPVLAAVSSIWIRNPKLRSRSAT
jgi:MFS family permease